MGRLAGAVKVDTMGAQRRARVNHRGVVAADVVGCSGVPRDRDRTPAGSVSASISPARSW